MKKWITILLTAAMVLSLAACGNSGANKDSGADASSGADSSDDSSGSDMEYVKGKGKLVIGITDFEPMDYKADGDEWIGFDADMAKAFAESLGVEAEFVEIDWDNKIMELDGKTIDCVWNGMTLTSEVTSSMECSNAYCNNAQVVIVPSDVADKYQDKDSLSDLTFAVEAGSAGEEAVENLELEFTSVKAQADALMEVAAGTSDAAIIDLLMAGAMIGEGTSYPNLTHTTELTTEEYGVGCRKGSDLASFINAAMGEAYADGTMQDLAVTYGVQEALVEQPASEFTEAESDSDVAYIKDKGTLIVGITEFEPMDYKDEAGVWIGFDADMARVVAEKLGVEAEFVVIDWDNKIMELESKNIDVVWNGMTLTAETTAAMECTNAYCNNAQVVVVPSN